MQKSLVWKGFLSESKQIEDYINLSVFDKFVFWMDYPFSYSRYFQVVLWDRVDRLHSGDSGASHANARIEIVEMTGSALKKAYSKLAIIF